MLDITYMKTAGVNASPYHHHAAVSEIGMCDCKPNMNRYKRAHEGLATCWT